MWTKRRCRVRKKNKSERGGEVKITKKRNSRTVGGVLKLGFSRVQD
jgi:hypothetical protein